ncbi:MAG: hypothetical protein GXP27_10435, partial [Planctomycetes bacterium]|nr:hypothetical protein [Planctomycetota bacterium]
GNTDEALAFLAKVFPGQKRFIYVRYIAGLIRGVIQEDADLFLDNLDELLQWNERTARRKRMDAVCDDLIFSLPGLGLSALAVKRGLVDLADLPEDCVHFPREMVEWAQTSERGVEHIEWRTFSELLDDTAEEN